MSEKIGKFIVEGLKRGGNVTEPKNIQIQTRNLGETRLKFLQFCLAPFLVIVLSKYELSLTTFFSKTKEV